MNELWFFFQMLIKCCHNILTPHIIDSGEGRMISMYDS